VEKALATLGILEATLRVPDAIGDLEVRADLKTRQMCLSVSFSAPTEGRPKSRINWLLRQLAEAWQDLRIEVWYPHARESVAATLEQVRAQPDTLLFSVDPKREPRSFTLTLNRPMGQKRGRTEGSFVRETRAQAVTFYRDLVQNLKAWQVRPPQIRPDADSPERAPVSAPDILPLLPKDLVQPGTSNDDMIDFSTAALPISGQGEATPADFAQHDAISDGPSSEETRKRVQEIGKRVVAEREDALQILEHDSESSQ
jgi:hypothetical protein